MTLQLGVGLGTIPKKYVIEGTVNKQKDYIPYQFLYKSTWSISDCDIKIFKQADAGDAHSALAALV